MSLRASSRPCRQRAAIHPKVGEIVSIDVDWEALTVKVYGGASLVGREEFELRRSRVCAILLKSTSYASGYRTGQVTSRRRKWHRRGRFGQFWPSSSINSFAENSAISMRYSVMASAAES